MKKLIIANWKLNPLTVAEAKKLGSRISKDSPHTVVLCPPPAFVGSVDYPTLGSQDVFWKYKGPFTGQVSAEQLKSLKVKYCIVGHSERREFGDSNEQIRGKIEALLGVGITPVLCIGFGTTVEEDDLEVIDDLKKQLSEAFKGNDPEKIVVAYEPVWAISKGNPYATKKMETPQHAEKIAIFIKTKYGVKKVLYGGSVTSVNAQSFLDQPHLDGLLVGGASLLPDDFNKIIS